MNARERRREETRQRLIEVARARFIRSGFEDTQLRDIAREAEVALGTIFVHFADKRDLLCAALYSDLVVAAERAAAVEAEDLEVWLDQVTAVYLDAYLSRPTLARAMLREALLADPPWRERFAACIGQIAVAVQQRAEVERAAGRLAPDADTRVLAGAWVSFFNFALIAWAQKAHSDPRRFVATLIHQHLRGVQYDRVPK